MTELQATMIASAVGAGVGSVFSVISMLINSSLTKRRSRRQQVCQRESDRLLELEERAGRVIEIAASHRGLDEIRNEVGGDLARLANDAGRFRRYRGIMLAVRGLHHEVNLLIDAKKRHADWREHDKEVGAKFQKLLVECDAVTGSWKP